MQLTKANTKAVLGGYRIVQGGKALILTLYNDKKMQAIRNKKIW